MLQQFGLRLGCRHGRSCISELRFGPLGTLGGLYKQGGGFVPVLLGLAEILCSGASQCFCGCCVSSGIDRTTRESSALRRPLTNVE
jgi:hypothetical protein